MLHESLNLCGRALRRVRVEIQRGDDADSITATVYFLLICELFISTSFDSPGWMHHAAGMLSLYNSHESRRSKPGASSCCFLQWRYMFSLGYGLLAKRSVQYKPPAWRDDRRQRYPLTAIVMRVPTSLEKLAQLRTDDSAAASARLADVVDEAMDLRQTMHECIIEWSCTVKDVPYRTVSLDEYPEFETVLGDLSGLFPAVYRFSDMTAAQLHRSFWTCLLELDQAIVDVRGMHWDAIACLERHKLDDLEAELPTCAYHLCQSLPWFGSPEVHTAGPISSLEPLYFLERHFQRHGRASTRLGVDGCVRIWFWGTKWLGYWRMVVDDAL